MLRTSYCRRLYSGQGYQHRRSFASKLAQSALWMLRIAGLIGLSFALPAQAHGSTIASPQAVHAQIR
jgi:hypothetical protein